MSNKDDKNAAIAATELKRAQEKREKWPENTPTPPKGNMCEEMYKNLQEHLRTPGATRENFNPWGGFGW